MDLTWPAIAVITTAGITVVGWVWTATRENRADHDAIRRELQRSTDEKTKDLERRIDDRCKELRGVMDTENAEARLDHNKLANKQAEFELHVATDYMRSDAVLRFEEKLDKLADKLEAFKDEWRKDELERRTLR